MSEYRDIAAEVLRIEGECVLNLCSNLDSNFDAAVEAILRSSGRTIVCGMGKSGIIGRKISATLASTGTPSFFMHPAEAYHGDLGMVAAEDVFVTISNSGETDEIVKLIPFITENSNFHASLTGNSSSRLAKAADVHIHVGVAEEACPLQLAPTASTTAALAMGDALAISIMKARGFQPANFARFHPGGSLGRRLLRRVDDEMVANPPSVRPADFVLQVLHAMTQGGHGVVLVLGGPELGIITDGDIRRGVENYQNEIFERTANEIMTRSPVTVSSGTRVEDALKLMQNKAIASLVVLENGKPVGLFKK